MPSTQQHHSQAGQSLNQCFLQGRKRPRVDLVQQPNSQEKRSRKDSVLTDHSREYNTWNRQSQEYRQAGWSQAPRQRFGQAGHSQSQWKRSNSQAEQSHIQCKRPRSTYDQAGQSHGQWKRTHHQAQTVQARQSYSQLLMDVRKRSREDCDLGATSSYGQDSLMGVKRQRRS